MNHDTQNTIKLYELLKTGQLTSGNNRQDKNYESYSYAISENQSIEITLEAADPSAFDGKEDEKISAKNAKLKAMQNNLIAALIYHGLHTNPPMPDYQVILPNMIRINASGYSKLRAMRAIPNGPNGPINTDALKKAIAVPEKLINLYYGEKEIKTKIVKDIIENRDEHFTFVGNDSGVNSYVCVKQEYAAATTDLLGAFENCIISLHILRQPGHQATKFITETIAIDLFDHVFENSELTAIKQSVSSNETLQTLLKEFKQNLDSKNFKENDDYIFDDNCFQFFDNGIEKLRRIEIDFQMKHLCDQSTQKTSTSTKFNLIRTVLSTQNSNGNGTIAFLNCSNTIAALFQSLIRFYNTTQFTSKRPHVFIFSNYQRNIQDVIYLGRSGYANVYGSVNPRSTGQQAALIRSRSARQSTFSQIQLQDELSNIFDQIKNRDDKVDHFKENGSIVAIFKKTKDLTILNALFNFLIEGKEDIDFHSSIFGTFLFWKGNTDSFITLLGHIRQYAMEQFREQCREMNIAQAENFREACIQLEIFNYHRKNNVLAWIFLKTDAVKEIIQFVDDMQQDTFSDESESENSNDESDDDDNNEKSRTLLSK